MCEATEQQIQKAILQALEWNEYVAWVMRVNSGLVTTQDDEKETEGGKFSIFGFKESGKKRYIRMAPAGTADIIGMLKGGAFFAIEVKKPGGKATKLQQEFLERIRKGGGLAGVATNEEQAFKILAKKNVLTYSEENDNS